MATTSAIDGGSGDQSRRRRRTWVRLGFARGFRHLVVTWRDKEAQLRCYGEARREYGGLEEQWE